MVPTVLRDTRILGKIRTYARSIASGANLKTTTTTTAAAAAAALAAGDDGRWRRRSPLRRSQTRRRVVFIARRALHLHPRDDPPVSSCDARSRPLSRRARGPARVTERAHRRTGEKRRA